MEEKVVERVADNIASWLLWEAAQYQEAFSHFVSVWPTFADQSPHEAWKQSELTAEVTAERLWMRRMTALVQLYWLAMCNKRWFCAVARRTPSPDGPDGLLLPDGTWHCERAAHLKSGPRFKVGTLLPQRLTHLQIPATINLTWPLRFHSPTWRHGVFKDEAYIDPLRLAAAIGLPCDEKRSNTSIEGWKECKITKTWIEPDLLQRQRIQPGIEVSAIAVDRGWRQISLRWLQRPPGPQRAVPGQRDPYQEWSQEARFLFEFHVPHALDPDESPFYRAPEQRWSRAIWGL